MKKSGAMALQEYMLDVSLILECQPRLMDTRKTLHRNNTILVFTALLTFYN